MTSITFSFDFSNGRYDVCMYSSSSSMKKGKKIKGQRAHKAGAEVEGTVGLKVSDPNVRLCLRRLGDSCNSISQRLMKHATLCQGAKDGQESENPMTQDLGGGVGLEGSMREECLSLAHRLFSSSLVIFEAVGDICNAAMIRCNLSSLLRSQATWEMDAHTTHISPSSSKKDIDVNTSYGAYRACFSRSLLYLNEAQEHCDQAVVLFQGGSSSSGSSSSGREDSSEQNKTSIPIPKGNIRNAVALETALTCLNLGKQRLFFLPSFLSFFLSSFLSFFLPFLLPIFLPFFLPSILPSFLPSFLSFFLSSFLPSFLPSFMYHIALMLLCSDLILQRCCLCLYHGMAWHGTTM